MRREVDSSLLVTAAVFDQFHSGIAVCSCNVIHVWGICSIFFFRCYVFVFLTHFSELNVTVSWFANTDVGCQSSCQYVNVSAWQWHVKKFHYHFTYILQVVTWSSAVGSLREGTAAPFKTKVVVWATQSVYSYYSHKSCYLFNTIYDY